MTYSSPGEVGALLRPVVLADGGLSDLARLRGEPGAAADRGYAREARPGGWSSPGRRTNTPAGRSPTRSRGARSGSRSSPRCASCSRGLRNVRPGAGRRRVGPGNPALLRGQKDAHDRAPAARERAHSSDSRRLRCLEPGMTEARVSAIVDRTGSSASAGAGTVAPRPAAALPTATPSAVSSAGPSSSSTQAAISSGTRATTRGRGSSTARRRSRSSARGTRCATRSSRPSKRSAPAPSAATSTAPRARRWSSAASRAATRSSRTGSGTGSASKGTRTRTSIPGARCRSLPG